MEYILSALSASVLSYLWIEVFGIDLLLKKWLGMDESQSFKPLDCRLGLSFGVGVLYCANDREAVRDGPLLSGLVERLMWRLEI